MGGYSLVAVRVRLLIGAAFLVTELGLWGVCASVVAARGLGSSHVWALGQGLTAVVHRLCCSVAYGIFQDQGSNLCLLLWQADSLPLSHQEAHKLFLLLLFFFKLLTSMRISTEIVSWRSTA